MFLWWRRCSIEERVERSVCFWGVSFGIAGGGKVVVDGFVEAIFLIGGLVCGFEIPKFGGG